MKKGIFLFTLIFILGCGATVFAAKVFDDGGAPAGITGVMADFTASKNVEIHIKGVAQTYAAVSGHLNGNREFGSSSGDPKLYWKGKDAGTAVAAADVTASDSSAFGTGWSAL